MQSTVQLALTKDGEISDLKQKLFSVRDVKALAGEWLFYYTEDKSKTLHLDIDSISRKILKEVRYDSSKLKTAATNYNKNIKEFLKAVGFKNNISTYERKGIGNSVKKLTPKHELITSHNLRDTFITQAIRKNVPIPMILRATGQSSYEVMKKYIKLENKDMLAHTSNLF